MTGLHTFPEHMGRASKQANKIQAQPTQKWEGTWLCLLIMQIPSSCCRLCGCFCSHPFSGLTLGFCSFASGSANPQILRPCRKGATRGGVASEWRKRQPTSLKGNVPELDCLHIFRTLFSIQLSTATETPMSLSTKGTYSFLQWKSPGGSLDFRYGWIQVLKQFTQDCASLLLSPFLPSILISFSGRSSSSTSSSNLAAHQGRNQGRKKLSFPGAPAKVLQLSLTGLTWMLCSFLESGNRADTNKSCRQREGKGGSQKKMRRRNISLTHGERAPASANRSCFIMKSRTVAHRVIRG